MNPPLSPNQFLDAFLNKSEPGYFRFIDGEGFRKFRVSGRNGDRRMARVSITGDGNGVEVGILELSHGLIASKIFNFGLFTPPEKYFPKPNITPRCQITAVAIKPAMKASNNHMAWGFRSPGASSSNAMRHLDDFDPDTLHLQDLVSEMKLFIELFA